MTNYESDKQALNKAFAFNCWALANIRRLPAAYGEVAREKYKNLTEHERLGFLLAKIEQALPLCEYAGKQYREYCDVHGIDIENSIDPLEIDLEFPKEYTKIWDEMIANETLLFEYAHIEFTDENMRDEELIKIADVAAIVGGYGGLYPQFARACRDTSKIKEVIDILKGKLRENI